MLIKMARLTQRCIRTKRGNEPVLQEQVKVVEVVPRGTILAQPVVSVSLDRKIHYTKVMQSLKKVGVTVAQRQRVREMVLHGGWNAEE